MSLLIVGAMIIGVIGIVVAILAFYSYKTGDLDEVMSEKEINSIVGNAHDTHTPIASKSFGAKKSIFDYKKVFERGWRK